MHYREWRETRICAIIHAKTHSHPHIYSMQPRFRAFAALLGFSVAFMAIALPHGSALAQVYNGPGLVEGTSGVTGVTEGNLRTVVANIVNRILTYVAFVAVIVLIIAGLYLILSLGDDSAKEKAKKIVIYTAVGLILILVSKALVMFFISLIS